MRTWSPAASQGAALHAHKGGVCIVFRRQEGVYSKTLNLGISPWKERVNCNTNVSPTWSGEITQQNDTGPCSLLELLFSQLPPAGGRCLIPCPHPSRPPCSPSPAHSRHDEGVFPTGSPCLQGTDVPWWTRSPATSLGPGTAGRGQLGTPASSVPEGGLLTLVSFCRSPSSGMPRGATSRKSITWLRFFRMSWTSITPPLWQKWGQGMAPSVPDTATAIMPAQSVGLS